MRILRWLPFFCTVAFTAVVPFALAQDNTYAAENAEQVAKILGISQLVGNVHLIHERTPCDSTATEQFAMRQDILDTVVAASLEVDGVLAELGNERAQLSESSTVLQARRDRALNLINVANLVTGTGVGIAVNAMQFNSSTANVGNGLGVGSGAGSTVLSIIGIRRQGGSRRGVGRVPNMLAPLFGRDAQLNSSYPKLVLEYLHSAPPGQSPESGSRLDQLMAEWRRHGLLGAPGSAATEKKITRLTSSLDDKTKLSIDDLSDRMQMLADVSGRVALMKRDLAELMLSVREKGTCAQHSAHIVPENAWSELAASMEKMHAAMAAIQPSGNTDVDFVNLMLPHHQAAIDMAKAQLLHGNDPEMRRLAQEIITDQQSEIELMQLWLKRRGKEH